MHIRSLTDNPRRVIGKQILKEYAEDQRLIPEIGSIRLGGVGGAVAIWIRRLYLIGGCVAFVENWIHLASSQISVASLAIRPTRLKEAMKQYAAGWEIYAPKMESGFTEDQV